MQFGMYPITPGDLLGRLETFVKQNCGLSGEDVFLTSAPNNFHLEFPPSDKFVAIVPQNFPVWQSVVTGAGQSLFAAPGVENLGFDARIRMSVFTRLNTDQEFRQSQLITSDTLGILGTAINLVGAVQFWTAPTDDTANYSYLREPMRITDGPRLEPREYKKSFWSLVHTEYEMKFTCKLTTLNL